MKSEIELETAIENHADTVKRICLMYLKNEFDTDDIFQNVFLKYALSVMPFKNKEHEKAWIIRVTINACKDYLKSYWKKNIDLTDTHEDIYQQEKDENSEVIEAIRELPDLYKNSIYLFYFEGYKAKEIGRILNKSENTIYSILARAREKLKEKLGGEMLGQ